MATRAPKRAASRKRAPVKRPGLVALPTPRLRFEDDGWLVVVFPSRFLKYHGWTVRVSRGSIYSLDAEVRVRIGCNDRSVRSWVGQRDALAHIYSRTEQSRERFLREFDHVFGWIQQTFATNA